MSFLQIVFDVSLFLKQDEEILVAHLLNYGFDSFEHKEKHLHAYIVSEGFNISSLETYLSNYLDISVLSVNQLEEKNWNVIWESSFDPVFVNDNCVVRAPFHDVEFNCQFDIIISPKMAFGTGHHATTLLMMRTMLSSIVISKSVLDIGTGTGVLSILASKMGAQIVHAIDIDDYSYANSRENISLNNCNNIIVHHTNITNFNNHNLFDIILANINRNVLLSELNQYVVCLSENGILMLSGFLDSDLPLIHGMALDLGLKFKLKNEEKKWQCLVYTK
tara:strand:- start:21 stop:851 length:831 start_codon:yes stop_codon:yes gene_type:complete